MPRDDLAAIRAATSAAFPAPPQDVREAVLRAALEHAANPPNNPT